MNKESTILSVFLTCAVTLSFCDSVHSRAIVTQSGALLEDRLEELMALRDTRKTDGRVSRLAELFDIHAELQEHQATSREAISESYLRGSIPPIVHQYIAPRSVSQREMISAESLLKIASCSLAIQTWKSHDVPELYQEWSSSWATVNKNWLHIVWTDEENRKLVVQHYNALLPFYDGLPLHICRVDLVRVLILHRYGGVYTDLDSEALRPLEPLFASKQVVVGRMGHDFKSQQSIPNAFMASSIDQHFWLHFLEIIQKYKSRQRHQGLVVENVAGPMALKEAVDTYHRHLDSDDQRSDVAILEPGVVYPIDWSVKRHGQVPHICDWGGHQDVFNASACIAQHHPHAYSVQWWTHSWG